MKKILEIYFLLMVLMIYLPSAYAVPSFARQTGMDCAACHTSFPELTPFGREFKLNGYTLGERQLVPIAAMAQMSLTHVDKKSNSNGTYMQRQDDPTLDSIGLFLAGKITDNAGAFIQATYNNVNARNTAQGVTINHHSHSDNTDLRLIGNHHLFGKDLVVGLNVNNNPTVQDVWNSTPAWGFPFVSSALAGVGGSGGGIGGGHSTQIEGGLAQQSAGVGAYFWWNRSFYGELSMYGTADKIFRPMSLGNWYNNANNFALQSRNNPYWRFAYSRDWGSNSLMLGTYGMDLNLYPDATKRAGPTDHYLDTAVDAQYQYITDPHIATLQATYIHEKQNLNATYLNGGSNNLNNSLNTFRAKASYLYDRKYGATVYFIQNTGSRDAGLYTGNPTASPNTRYYIVELDYNPTTQMRISLQYTMYNMIDGANFNYDGTGRKASDNNTLYLYSWLAF